MKLVTACQRFSPHGSCKCIKPSYLQRQLWAELGPVCFCGSCAKIMLLPLKESFFFAGSGFSYTILTVKTGAENSQFHVLSV